MSGRKPQGPNVVVAYELLRLRPCARPLVYELLVPGTGILTRTSRQARTRSPRTPMWSYELTVIARERIMLATVL